MRSRTFVRMVPAASVVLLLGACSFAVSSKDPGPSPSPSIPILQGNGFDDYPPIPEPPGRYGLESLQQYEGSICFGSDPRPGVERDLRNLATFYRSTLPGLGWESVFRPGARDPWHRVFVSPADPCRIVGDRAEAQGYERAGSSDVTWLHKPSFISSQDGSIIIWTSPKGEDEPSRLFLQISVDSEVL